MEDPVLAELNIQLAIVRDRIKGVALGHAAGFYLYGRAGTAKTFTVRTTLESLDVDYVYANGHITPIGLFETIEEHPDSIIVLDDVTGIFRQPAAKNLLLAALGNQPNGFREVRYKRAGCNVKVTFTGGVIAISNVELHSGGDEVMAALKSRVQTVCYNPTDAQVAALINHIAKKGYKASDGTATPDECQDVAAFLLERCCKLNIRPDVRMFVDKAIKDFLLWNSGESESHWQDLIESALQDRLIALANPVVLDTLPSKTQQIGDELNLLTQLMKEQVSDIADRFMKITGHTLRTYQRRMRQLKAQRLKAE